MATDKKISDLPVASSIDASDTSILLKNGTDYQFAFSTLLELIGAELAVGASISFGNALPPNISGKNGDVFINTTAGAIAQKIAGTWTVFYSFPSGNNGDGTVLYGTSVPGAVTGKNGDTFINTLSGIFYKKSADAWNQVFSMQTGPAGATGPAGPTGAAGTSGKTILSGTGVPSNLYTGTNGDYYINTTTYVFYGPKTNGVWPAGFTLDNSEGEAIASETAARIAADADLQGQVNVLSENQNTVGPIGPQGPAGPTGATGATGPPGTSDAAISNLMPNQLIYGKSDGTLEQNPYLLFSPATETLNINANTTDVSSLSVVFLGDSIVSGGGTTDNKRFTKQVADGLSMTEVNNGQGGSTVVTFDLSAIPIKTSSLKYLFVALGVNDAASSTTNTQFKTDYITFLNAIVAKGWAYVDITLLSINGASTNGTSAAKTIAFNTAIEEVGVMYGTKFIDIYNPMLNAGYGQQLLTADLVHPNNLGATIMAQIILGAFGVTNFNASGKRMLVDGPVEFSKLVLKNPQLSSGQRLILLDDSENLVSSYALPDGVTTNGMMYLDGGLKQIGASDFVAFDSTRDVFLKADSKIGAGNNQGALILLYNGTTGSTEYRNYYNSGQHEFYVSNGVNGTQVLGFYIDNLGIATTPKGIAIGQTKAIQSFNGGRAGRITLFDNDGITTVENTYSEGRLDFKLSNGTDGISIKMMQIQSSGRLQIGSNISDSDIPSARVAISSTTEGFLKPRMTSMQRDAILTPAEGLEIYNLTTHKMNFYNGTAWETITSA
ncbi:GDSL-type esterase/lipase family protein [Mucilaginibacter dorajii]|uniref:SGNH hydrolase-type esterase domain-containing protein n=1 Tax=Mucilaginibacter dorajii TaxID=692994 RepID=A0ABP7RB83_9SPHI|nr:GDSL-type esterase/lipase family protein [Mucilaginibacter dorajii]MCS3736742.1 lysophospholipase L1-like esterase [Mucilaginibacter dorajii]